MVSRSEEDSVAVRAAGGYHTLSVPACPRSLRPTPAPLPPVSWRVDGWGGGGARGRWLLGGAPRVNGLRSCPSSVFAIWGSVHWTPGNCRQQTPGRPSAAPLLSHWRHRPWVPLSGAPLLLWGLGWRWWRVPRAVAPVDDGRVHGPGHTDVRLCVPEAEYRPPLLERRPPWVPVGPSRPNHGLDDPFVVLLGLPSPWGYVLVPPVPLEERGIERPLPLVPQGGPVQPPVPLQQQGIGDRV